ncbi:hypothetical protein EG68_01298 [Paragonimus skrjabini miyazakii]|uniref:Uncharacterized protein n=1 Tax=Paragonimus skrjabini miyazakii TaxID=59628 RepID=A0A8S9Z3G5_9TREM|nr:hypothetical protein EG68_01298 [Paragonimus skrjabini miyazakii]
MIWVITVRPRSGQLGIFHLGRARNREPNFTDQNKWISAKFSLPNDIEIRAFTLEILLHVLHEVTQIVPNNHFVRGSSNRSNYNMEIAHILGQYDHQI